MKTIKFDFINRIKANDCIEGGKRLFLKKKIKPIFSIITINLNDDLESTILSIKNQSFRNIIEHIIIDGKSRKGYLDLLKKYNKDIDYWISQSDKGIWDASNKGIQLSTGKFIGILDSGDILSKDASTILQKLYEKKKNADYIIGSVFRARLLSGYYPKNIKKNLYIIPSNSGGFYLRRDLQKKVGLFDLRYKSYADYDMIYKLIKQKKLNYICSKKSEIIAKKIPEGFSGNYGFINLLNEEIQLRLNNGENKINVYKLYIIRIIKKLISVILNIDGNKIVKYKYDNFTKRKIRQLNKFYEFIQAKKKFKKI